MEKSIVYFGESITGRRSNNEDSFLCEQIGERTYLFIVADGMGGSEHGEVASKLAVNAFLGHVKDSLNGTINSKQLKTVLEEGFLKTQLALKEEIEKDIAHSGMGTTLVVLLIHNGCYAWGNIGDSRLYRMDSKGIMQLTRDHTYIEDVLKKNIGAIITDDQLNKYSHIITRSISGGNDRPDLYPEGKRNLNLRSPKMFLLCSDGLISKKSSNKDEEDFLRIYKDCHNAEQFAKTLVNNAFEKGSEDNISAVCISIDREPVNPITIKSKKFLLPALILIVILILIPFVFHKPAKTILNAVPVLPVVPVVSVVPVVPVIPVVHDKAIDSIIIPVKKPPLKNRLSWHAFSLKEMVLTNNSLTGFVPYPKGALLEKYIVSIKDLSGRMIDSIYVNKVDKTISLKKSAKIMPGKTYQFGISAILKDKTRSSGGSVKIRIKK